MKPGSDNADAREILRTDERWIEAFNERDVETLVSIYDADAIVMPPDRDDLRGRDEIRAWLAAFFAANEAVQQLVNDEVIVAGDWAFLRGHFRLVVTPHDGSPRRLTGKHLVVWKRQLDGSWTAARDIWNTAMGTGYET